MVSPALQKRKLLLLLCGIFLEAGLVRPVPSAPLLLMDMILVHSLSSISLTLQILKMGDHNSTQILSQPPGSCLLQVQNNIISRELLSILLVKMNLMTRCVFPDASLGTALDSSKFEYIS